MDGILDEISIRFFGVTFLCHRVGYILSHHGIHSIPSVYYHYSLATTNSHRFWFKVDSYSSMLALKKKRKKKINNTLKTKKAFDQQIRILHSTFCRTIPQLQLPDLFPPVSYLYLKLSQFFSAFCALSLPISIFIHVEFLRSAAYHSVCFLPFGLFLPFGVLSTIRFVSTIRFSRFTNQKIQPLIEAYCRVRMSGEEHVQTGSQFCG